MSRYRTFKHTERRIARLLGGRRTGHLPGQADVAAGYLLAEVKHRQRLPAWLKNALAQARRAAGDARLGVAILHEHGQNSDGDLVVLSLRDWLDWFGD